MQFLVCCSYCSPNKVQHMDRVSNCKNRIILNLNLTQKFNTRDVLWLEKNTYKEAPNFALKHVEMHFKPFKLTSLVMSIAWQGPEVKDSNIYSKIKKGKKHMYHEKSEIHKNKINTHESWHNKSMTHIAFFTKARP